MEANTIMMIVMMRWSLLGVKVIIIKWNLTGGTQQSPIMIADSSSFLFAQNYIDGKYQNLVFIIPLLMSNVQICHISKDLVKSLRLNTKYWLWGLLGIQMRVTDGPGVPQGEGGWVMFMIQSWCPMSHKNSAKFRWCKQWNVSVAKNIFISQDILQDESQIG